MARGGGRFRYCDLRFLEQLVVTGYEIHTSVLITSSHLFLESRSKPWARKIKGSF